jgi:predicted glycoside hydrolase/deacetylase ChbG (UPF0249 family)
MLRHLVVNADDLGLTTGINDGIFDAHDLGILTSASLFANAPATDEAVRRLHARTSLGVGAHLALVDGTPTLPARSVPTLVTGDGRFPPSWRPFIVACLRGRVSLDEIERELTAQIERLLDAGVALTHLDAHKHVHAYPPVFAIVARLAVRFGIAAVRVPYERSSASTFLGRHSGSPETTRQQAWMNAMLWPWARRNYRVAARLGLRVPNFIGRIDTGILDRAAMRRLLRGVGAGVTELMVHPGYVDAALRQLPTRLVGSRLQEVALLSSMETRALLTDAQIRLVRHDLAPSVRRSLRHVS